MSLTLPPVGTSRMLELMSPYVPDDFFAEVCPRHLTGGRRHALSAAQLWRTHLLAVLTSTHSLQSARDTTARASRVAAFRPVAAHPAHRPDAP